jgi:hypothetical protein
MDASAAMVAAETVEMDEQEASGLVLRRALALA